MMRHLIGKGQTGAGDADSTDIFRKEILDFAVFTGKVWGQRNDRHTTFGEVAMMNRAGISRRDFVLAAGGAALLATGLPSRNGIAETDTFGDLVRNCGAIRLGYSTSCGIDPDAIEAEHIRQLAFLLSLCGMEQSALSPLSAGIKPNAEYPFPASLMTFLSDSDGRRLEIVTTSARLQMPRISLRGSDGSLHADDERVWFSTDAGELCAWQNDKNLLPPQYTKAYHAARKEACSDFMRICTARHILQKDDTPVC
jgi:hypothetical protein